MTNDDKQLEALSALMDGEADELEVRRVLGAVGSDESLRTRWQRHQWAREALHQGRVQRPGLDVSTRVQEALEDRPGLGRNPLWSMAVAASVTMAIVLGGQQWSAVEPDEMRVQNIVSAVGGGVVPVSGVQPVQASLATQSQLLTDRKDSGSAVSVKMYERFAEERYRRLSPIHAQISSEQHPAPYLFYVRTPAATGVGEQ